MAERGEQLREVLQTHGLRYSRPREVILTFFGERDRHVSAEELHLELRTRGENLSLSTVYLNLGVLKQAGLVREVSGVGGEAFYDSNVPSGVPNTQSRIWSTAALAAEAALDAPRAAIIAAPRPCTVGIKVSRVQPSSTSSGAACPFTVACDRSGTWVLEWLPQMITPCTSATLLPVFSAS